MAFVFIIIGLLQSPSFGSGLVATYTVVLVRKKESLLLRYTDVNTQARYRPCWGCKRKDQVMMSDLI